MSLIENAKILVRKWLPSRYGWSGDYNNWTEAMSHCVGYSDNLILEKVKASTLKVKEGKAVFERDSVIFDHIEYSWPLLSSLLWVSAQNNSTIKVLDFGGSLGTSFFQNKLFLDKLKSVKWGVVEQENFVKCGKEFIENEQLKFYYSIEEYIHENGLPDLLVLGCTIPYLQNPYDLLDELKSYGIPYIIIDDTPFNYENRDRLTVQKVPPSIYEASYPCWFLDYGKVISAIRPYEIVLEFLNESRIFLDGRPIRYRGMLAKFKSN
ncbi:MAG: methyltransferase, TIGR04325 family [Bacteroidetes bacterium]|nr:MAG: methyltransferase, TIGR04325 family [Bacteroidota bacterium]